VIGHSSKHCHYQQKEIRTAFISPTKSYRKAFLAVE
jgi:hypothetical protein